MSETILLVEDDVAIADMVEDALSRSGYRCARVQGASEAQRAIRCERPSLVLMDWMLQGISGVELVRRLRRDDASRGLPIIMLTARCEESDLVEGFDAGVDDYIGKPFSVRELMARVKAVLRRAGAAPADRVLEVGELVLDPISHRVTADGSGVKLGPTEFRMLRFFMENNERVFTRRQLLNNVWGNHVYVEERTVDVHIRRLRKALAASSCDRFVQTVHGTGYRFSREA